MKERYHVNNYKLAELNRECERVAKKHLGEKSWYGIILATQLIEGLTNYINDVWIEERTLEDLLANAELSNLDALMLLQKAKELKEKLK